MDFTQQKIKTHYPLDVDVFERGRIMLLEQVGCSSIKEVINEVGINGNEKLLAR